MAKKVIPPKRIVWTQNDLDRQFPESAWLRRQERAISHLLHSGKITRNVAERRRRELLILRSYWNSTIGTPLCQRN